MTAVRSTVVDDRRPPDAASPRRTGRRPGNADTRAEIVAAAREVFGEKGFAGATMRAIAVAAGVDAALIHHYFGSKRELFVATVELPIDPAAVVDSVTEGDPQAVGMRLVSALLTVWDSPAQAALLAMARSVFADPGQVRTVREFVVIEIVGRVFRRLRIPAEEARVRAPLVVSQVLGLILGRYLLAVPGLADAPRERLVATVGPTLQHYIAGELPL